MWDPPEPLAAETRNGENPPVDEDPKLGLVVPFWQRAGVDGFPVGIVSNRSACTEKQKQHYETNGNKHFELDQLANKTQKLRPNHCHMIMRRQVTKVPDEPSKDNFLKIRRVWFESSCEGGIIPTIRHLRRLLLRTTLGYKLGASFKKKK